METADAKTYLRAEARLVGRQWIVEKCPHCGKRHVHGAGDGGVDARELLTHKNLYCHPDGYVLVEIGAQG